MATFAERFVVYNTPAFKQRVGIALARIAYSILAENAPGRHELNRKRWGLARLVLEDPVKLADRFALLAAAFDVPLTEPDESLENIIRQGYDAIAGVTPEDHGGRPSQMPGRPNAAQSTATAATSPAVATLPTSASKTR